MGKAKGSTNETSKLKWTKPKLGSILTEFEVAEVGGDCVAGATDVTHICSNGDAATGGCSTGNTAESGCTPGTSLS